MPKEKKSKKTKAKRAKQTAPAQTKAKNGRRKKKISRKASQDTDA